MANTNLTISDIPYSSKVFINGHVYTYQGQERKKQGGFSKSVYVFKLVDTSKVPVEFWEKTFDVTAKLNIRQYGKKNDEVKFEIY